MNISRYPVLTIGHSTHSADAFVKLLKQHQITAVADVRSSPYSRFSPQFNREALPQTLKKHDIKYVFLGLELGARSTDLSCYENGRVQYARLAQTELFHSGIERILRGATEYRIALMCAEKEPLECHRTLLVARALVEQGVQVEHILANGKSESHEATMERLLDIVGLPHHDLYATKDELLTEALSQQEQRVAYIDKRMVANPVGEAL
jgi:uncharacterized protein (DUF488 family)